MVNISISMALLAGAVIMLAGMAIGAGLMLYLHNRLEHQQKVGTYKNERPARLRPVNRSVFRGSGSLG